MKLSAPTISVYVELLVLSFCLVELTMGNPHPKDRPPPDCPLMLGWTANDTSTHLFKIPLPLALTISGIVRVPMMYLIRWNNLVQSSLSGSRTLVIKNAIVVQVSGISRLLTYTVFTTRLRNYTSLFLAIFSQLSSTLKILSGAALVFVRPPFGYFLSKAVIISSP
jgi:hypothetical protein